MVVVVDDDTASLAELEDFVGEIGFPCRTFSAPDQALAFIRRRTRPLILMSDVRMPTLGGIELTGMVRDDEASSGPPVEIILFSGHSGFNEAVQALRYGIVDFLLKPIDLRHLEQTVRLAADQIEARLSAAEQRDKVHNLLSVVVKTAQTILAPEQVGAASAAAPAADNRRAGRGGEAEGGDGDRRLRLIKLIQGNRRIRDRIFPNCTGGDVYWEMILFVAEQEILGRQVSVTSACHATTIPQTTALRKIDELVEAGLLVRNPAADDRRRILLRPTPACTEAINRYLDATAEQLAAIRSEQS